MQRHIDSLQTCLLANHWTLLEEQEGNGLDISGRWVIRHASRPDKTLTLGFEGMGDLDVLPMAQSYGCFLVENHGICLYFSKNNRAKWQRDVRQFVVDLTVYVQAA